MRYTSPSRPQVCSTNDVYSRPKQNDWSDLILTISATVQTTSWDQCQTKPACADQTQFTISLAHTTSQHACNSAENAWISRDGSLLQKSNVATTCSSVYNVIRYKTLICPSHKYWEKKCTVIFFLFFLWIRELQQLCHLHDTDVHTWQKSI